jgi:hypothetical protein
MKRSILYTLLIGVIVLNHSCKNKDCIKNGTCPSEYYKYMLEEGKNYLWAKPGSYWIYKNTKTGDLDTQICTSIFLDTIIKKGTQTYSQHITFEYERLVRTVQSSFDQWVYYDETSKYNPDGTPSKGFFYALERQVFGEGIISAFHFPFTDKEISGTGSEVTSYKGMDSSLVLQSKTYYNVAKFELDRDDIWYPNDHPIATRYPNAVYYWAKDVGLIKRQNKSENYNWELVDYHIIQ